MIEEQLRKELQEATEKYTDIILDNQDSNGPFPATAETDYEYSGFRWIRDSSFTTLGLVTRLSNLPRDTLPHRKLSESIEANFEWWFNRIKDSKDRLEDLLGKESVTFEYFLANALPTRFTKEGKIEENPDWALTGKPESWPLAQLDGYGSFLSVLGQYVRATESHGSMFLDSYREQINHLFAYLSKFHTFPNYSMWEDKRDWGDYGCSHSSTLGSIVGGMNEMMPFGFGDVYAGMPQEIAVFLNRTFRDEKGRIVKYVHRNENGQYVQDDSVKHVDSGMLLLSVPFDSVYQASDPNIGDIADRIEHELTSEDGGVQRYPHDHFYGGGRWPLLSALQGMFYLERGDTAKNDFQKATRNALWILRGHDPNFNLPEQIVDDKDTDEYREWTERFGGEPTSPLLMGHGFSVAFFEKLSYKLN